MKGTSIAVAAPFATTGSSRVDDGGYIVMQLEVRGVDGHGTTIGAIADEVATVRPRDEWFDGALLAPQAHAGEFIVAESERLVSLRDALVSLE